MGFNHRKLLDDDQSGKNCRDKPPLRPVPLPKPATHPKSPMDPQPPPHPQHPPPPPQGDHNHTSITPTYVHNHMSITRTYVMTYLICGVVLCAVFFIILRMYYSRRNNRRNNRSESEGEGEGEGEDVLFGTRADFLDEDHSMRIDNPIRYINTVGLQQSVIDSIAVFKYKSGEGLIDGTDCSVCLNEFQEDESLRLLPKCSHAFHIPCIDTWLRSHKTCPLCRAPVVCDAVVDQASVSVPDVNIDSGSREETRLADSENSELGANDVGEDGNREMLSRDDNLGTQPTTDENSAGSSKKGLPHSESRVCDSEFPVLTDLAGIRQRVEEDVQPRRRSVSLDSPSAMMIYSAVAGLRQFEHQGNTETELVRVQYMRSKIGGRRGSGSSTRSKMMKSSSIGPFMSKGSISVKRSLSSGGKFLLCKGKKPVLDPSFVNLRSV